MTASATFGELRDDVVTHLRKAYLGPFEGPDEFLRDRPDRVYLVGTLYPRGVAARSLDGDTLGDDATDEALDQPVELANAWHPASTAISFLHGASALIVDVHGGHYERRPEGGWKRRQLTALGVPVEPASAAIPLLDGRARLVTVWRRRGEAWLVTVALENSAFHDNAEAPPPTEDCLFQVSLKCTAVGGEICEYPASSVLNEDPEEQELRLLYASKKVFGVGHSCSVEWGSSADSSQVTWVRSEMMPQAIVSGVWPGDRSQQILKLSHLADETIDRQELARELTEFVSKYRSWVDDRAAEAEALPQHHSDVAQRLVGRMRAAASRMQDGVEYMCGDSADSSVLLSFRLANRAMREQILQTRMIKGSPGSRGRDLPERPDEFDEPSWYPFQLAFQLVTLASTTDPHHVERDTVDLIWFPTGGGKTEAYLALAAFKMIHRRLTRGIRGGGTAVLTRYTLRMLTAQQFQRAATLVCALERIRLSDERLDGKPEFTIGLWVGGDTTPNDFSTAHDLVQKLLKAQEPENPFQINDCPWCGTPLTPRRRLLDKSAYGVVATKTSFDLFCTHKDCEFHAGLPVRVIDEQIFANPPTLLVATVDKFARMPWTKDSGAVLGRGNVPYDAPDLVIQDELHLLSGPLGTTVAVYEAAVMGLIGWDGNRPKIVASTATIRSASEQVQRLYGSEVALFPPSGLDADNSYFARVDDSSPGRLYVGLMPQAHTQSYATVLTCAALLEAPVRISKEPATIDAYWTVVAYHNSLRELGRTVTIARDDVDSLLTARAATASGDARRMSRDGVIELTSNVRPALLIKFLSRLERTIEQGDAVDLVATTNMLSVGIDISRLGLMLMNGQPKTTSEYIQATSRVGRSTVPGLVVTLLRAGKPRDRSHYESFRAYHESLYRNVEPTSVTPWSMASRERSLHAALVMLVRHGCGLRGNEEAGNFHSADRSVDKAVRLLLNAVRRAEPGSESDAESELRRLVADWDRRSAEAREAGRVLRYESSDKDYPALLRNFGERKEGWETMHSMRSVDRQVRVLVTGEQL
jgi:hypothetical protein